MGRSSPRGWLRQAYLRAFMGRVNTPNAHELGRSALVFAPHQDDETLGCGGTILRKRALGSAVRIVYMTDGRQSHSHLLPVEELVAIRQHEALAACEALDIADEQVTFLGFKDGELSAYADVAIPRVLQLLETYQPAELFIPYLREPQADHIATHKIVMAAIEAYGRSVTIYEYPVWFWYQWPWVSLRQDMPPGSRAVGKNTLLNGLGWRFMKEFRYAVYIGDALERKAVALNKHKSQMTQLRPDSRWLTLHDVADGEFLACFFQGYELFHHYTLEYGKAKDNKL